MVSLFSAGDERTQQRGVVVIVREVWYSPPDFFYYRPADDNPQKHPSGEPKMLSFIKGWMRIVDESTPALPTGKLISRSV